MLETQFVGSRERPFELVRGRRGGGTSPSHVDEITFGNPDTVHSQPKRKSGAGTH